MPHLNNKLKKKKYNPSHQQTGLPPHSALPGRKQWQPTPVLLPGKSHGWRSLIGCSPWGRWESDMTERLHFHFSLFWIWEGNGNPLQCSCLENLRDRGAWWAAVYGVSQIRTQLKRLSSSSNSSLAHQRKNKTNKQTKIQHKSHPIGSLHKPLDQP